MATILWWKVSERVMNIDIKEYFLNQIGNTEWYGESNHDNESSKNLDKVDQLLFEIENFREELISILNQHITYRKGNASSEHLHKKAKSIREKHIIKEFTHTDFESYFEEVSNE